MSRRAAARGDDGNVLVAMLGILSMTTVVLVGLAAILLGQQSSRHDTRFERALGAAETGLDRLLTQVKAAPYAPSFPVVTGTEGSTSWSAKANGSPGAWTLTSSGTASDGKGTVTRTVTEQVTATDLLAHPLFADTALTLGGSPAASGVDNYDSAVSSKVCSANGILGDLLGGVASGVLLATDMKMCTPATPVLGRAGTNGALTMKGGSLSNLAGVDVHDAGVPGYPSPDAHGRCVGDSATCAAVGGKVQLHEDELDFPMSNLCQNGIGAGAGVLAGDVALAANAVYSVTDVTLNAEIVANLNDLGASTIVICFSGDLLIPPLLPINMRTDVIGSGLSLLPLEPRPPATLLFVSTKSSGPPPTVTFGLPIVGSLLPAPVTVSAVVYAPNATCTATGHVELFGAVVCGSLTAANGIDVHYDTRLGTLPFDQPITVSGWREVSGQS